VLHLCPACQRSFDEPGFCPFDRAALVPQSTPDQQTLLSAAMPAARPLKTAPDGARRTDIEPRRTFPITPTPASTQEMTASRARAPSTPAEPSIVRALSASENPAQALASYHTKHEREYDQLVGQTLDGRYFIQEKIGEGGMGVVFSARHAVIERPLAIKVLKREVMRDAATIKRFVQEAKAASRIGHPNIVDVTDFGTTPDGMTYSVMEFVTGQTLGSALRHSAPFSAARAIKVAAQISRALGAAHDKGIVHRDLKPENVFLVDRDGRTDFVKIVDFGIAKVAPVAGADPNEPRLTRAGSVFGTPEYMAPEQAAGRGDTDGRVDIYALGVILYEMITGRVPHRGDSTVRTLAMQMLDPVEPPSKIRPDLAIRPELEALILKALSKKREHRYQTMGELLAALEHLQTPVGVSVTGTPIFALTPLPPGADPAITPSPSTIDTAPVHLVQSRTDSDAARSKPPTNRRLRDEPEFVTRDKPATFEHVFTRSPSVADDEPLPRRRWPILVLGALILGGAAGAIALVAKSHGRAVAKASRDAGDGLVVAEAAVVVLAEPDAGVLVVVPVDAADLVVLEPDAGRVAIARPPRDAAAVVAVIPNTPNGRGTISIQIITKPEGANLYEGHSYRGPGGTNMEQPFGAKVDLTCRKSGYKPGTVQLVFDGKTEYAMCVLTRIKICINNIKNPFDDCELDPSAPMP